MGIHEDQYTPRKLRCLGMTYTELSYGINVLYFGEYEFLSLIWSNYYLVDGQQRQLAHVCDCLPL